MISVPEIELKTIPKERLQKLSVEALQEEHDLEQAKAPTKKGMSRIEKVLRVVVLTYIIGFIIIAILWSLYDLIWGGADQWSPGGGRGGVYLLDSLGQ